MDEAERLIATVREVAARHGTRWLSREDFRRERPHDVRRAGALFGTWPALCAAAGLAPHPYNRRVPEAEIFSAMHFAFLRHGEPCTQQDFVRDGPCAKEAIRRRFGSWPGALAAFRVWAQENAPGAPYLAALDRRLEREDRRRAALPVAPPAAGPTWPARGGRPSGEPLGFRALMFAPVNEQGVVLLFGMVAGELGYAVETVTAGFPDCTARRRVGGGRWESVRIEFEYRSRAFREHGHDVGGCDVIVCWEHDWPGCPLEVLALRSALAALPPRAGAAAPLPSGAPA